MVTALERIGCLKGNNLQEKHELVYKQTPKAHPCLYSVFPMVFFLQHTSLTIHCAFDYAVHSIYCALISRSLSSDGIIMKISNSVCFHKTIFIGKNHIL